jgi:hypothetical protein
MTLAVLADDHPALHVAFAGARAGPDAVTALDAALLDAHRALRVLLGVTLRVGRALGEGDAAGAGAKGEGRPCEISRP